MRSMMPTTLLSCLALAACGRTEQPPPEVDLPEVSAAPPEALVATGQAVLAGKSGRNTGGAVHLRATVTGVTIEGTITGLEPESVHAIHVHETGDCSAPDASSARGHLNPGNHPHGGPATRLRHLGDLPNLEADSQGNAGILVTVEGASLTQDGPYSLMDKAIVVHARPDDYMTQPAGDAGDRIACGVIEPQVPPARPAP